MSEIFGVAAKKQLQRQFLTAAILCVEFVNPIFLWSLNEFLEVLIRVLVRFRRAKGWRKIVRANLKKLTFPLLNILKFHSDKCLRCNHSLVTRSWAKEDGLRLSRVWEQLWFIESEWSRNDVYFFSEFLFEDPNVNHRYWDSFMVIPHHPLSPESELSRSNEVPTSPI